MKNERHKWIIIQNNVIVTSMSKYIMNDWWNEKINTIYEWRAKKMKNEWHKMKNEWNKMKNEWNKMKNEWNKIKNEWKNESM